MTYITESERIEGWKPVAPMEGCTFGSYEGSDKGQVRSVDRKLGNRQLKGKVLSIRPNDDGYMLVNIRCDSTDPEHKRVHTVSVHKIVLTTFDKPCPPGLEACHSNRGPAFNWWPEGIRWDTKASNRQDMVAAGTAVTPPPSFPCRNHDRCGAKVKSPGRRCLECVTQVGESAGQLLTLGLPLRNVAEQFGYQNDDWVYKLAVEFGGYAGTKAGARTQRPKMSRRVALWRCRRSLQDV